MTDSNRSSSSALFQVYLRLRPSANASSLYPTITSPERFLAVEPPETNSEHDLPTHITLNPPNDSRRRAVEKFAFTKVFEEHSSQLDLFHGTGIIELVEGVLGSTNCESRDGLLATLGVTGSGKSHTILGSKSQRGLTQLALDLLYRSIGPNLLTTQSSQSLHATVAASDHSEAQVLTAQMFMDMINGDIVGSRAGSRAPTPARVRPSHVPVSAYPSVTYPTLPLLGPASILGAVSSPSKLWAYTASKLLSYMSSTVSKETKSHNVDPKTDIQLKGESFMMPPPTPSRRGPLRPSVLPQLPDISSTSVDVDHNAEYAVVISMYEVYNDRIFDLLTPATKTAATKEYRRRPLLFKSTEQSADRKVVAGLRKIICGSVREALNVLEAGIHERRVAGTGSNTVSSRSHGFFCVEVKKRRRGRVTEAWNGNTMTIVDLAGSERARDAKTAGATLQEAGKINESLMYLGQCLQMQSDAGSSTKPNLVPFRQCKLTELLFSNSFPSSTTTTHQHRTPQRAIMIVTADPLGDFNATSQILRYSALAREITVPRIPSVSTTILAGLGNPRAFSGLHGPPSDTERETMELAALEIARMSEEIDGLRDELRAETERRMIADAHCSAVEERLVEVEADVREECYAEMEQVMLLAQRKWRAQWDDERERGEEHVDKKIDLLSRACIDSPEDDEGEDKENAHVETLEGENERLKRQIAQLTRQLESQTSPSKKNILGENKLFEVERSLRGLSFDGDHKQQQQRQTSQNQMQSSPLKKVRKITARKWDMMGEDELL